MLQPVQKIMQDYSPVLTEQNSIQNSATKLSRQNLTHRKILESPPFLAVRFEEDSADMLEQLIANERIFYPSLEQYGKFSDKENFVSDFTN